jgi:hypothetical protein
MASKLLKNKRKNELVGIPEVKRPLGRLGSR